MKNLLLTFGCSFTYGEALEFHYWKDNYPTTFNLYKNKQTYFPSSLIMASMDELTQYREKNRYSGILKNFLNFGLMTKSENGGCNYRNIERLDILLDYLKVEKEYTPKYCVFQFTSIIRDILEFTRNEFYTPNDDGVRWLGSDIKKELIENINLLDDSLRRGVLNKTISDIFLIIYNKLLQKFEILESMGCKCVFFVGMEDRYSHHLIYDIIKQSPHYIPITFNGTEYMSWDTMNRDCYLTLRQNIGVNDDHPCLDSHKWLANLLYKKYLELTK